MPSFATSLRFQALFFNERRPKLGSKVRLLNEDPPIYQIDDFLSPNEYHYFNQICTQYEKSFLASFTENDQNGKVTDLFPVPSLTLTWFGR